MDKFVSRIDKKTKEILARLKAYVRRLLFPLYLFPIKIITYSVYYLFKYALKLLWSLVKIFFETITFPFRSLKNFIKSIFIIGLVVYVLASVFVIFDYLSKEYGYIGKFFCSYGVNYDLKNSVVRVVGGYSEGSGFFISEDQVITNFHVIADEPSPKIIFPNGDFATPTKITGDKDADLAILYLGKKHPDMILDFLEPYELMEDEKLISAGYPLGTNLAGEATAVKGRFITFRESKYYPVAYVHTDINVVEGMSGGPLVDQCGDVVGINTLSLSGQSLFVSSDDVQRLLPDFTDQEITKIEVDPSESPEEAVRAFYVYLKARRMQDGFDLLSEEYLLKTNYEEWTNRFTDVLDVQVHVSEPYEEIEDTAFVKFQTKNWNDGEVDYHYYEGTWETVEEDGVHKMNKSKIKEIFNPSWDWYYSDY
ncbi:S1C family serine protease [Patescibacteria group bacterium]